MKKALSYIDSANIIALIALLILWVNYIGNFGLTLGSTLSTFFTLVPFYVPIICLCLVAVFLGIYMRRGEPIARNFKFTLVLTAINIFLMLLYVVFVE